MNNILDIKNLSKKYHTNKSEINALENISFSVKGKEYVSIIGPSGCGKSTILSILANITDKSTGSIVFKNNDFRIGYMLQDDSLFPWRTVLENCYLGLEIKNELTKENKLMVKNLLIKYGLKDFVNSYPNMLSGGMRQRVECLL